MKEFENLNDRMKEIFDKKEFIVPNLPKPTLPNLNMIEDNFEFNPEDNVLFQIEENQKEEIKKLKDLIDKKDIEIAELKKSSKKELKRFWLTFAITTLITLTIGILGIIF